MIPLTIKHTKEDIPFFTMPKTQLLSLLNIEYEKLFDEQGGIEDDWIKNKRCLCARNPMVQEKKIHLNCGHLKRKLKGNKIIKEAEKKIERMSSALIIRNLTKHKPFADKVKEYFKGDVEINSQ